MDKSKYIEILNQVYDRLAVHRSTSKWATTITENFDVEEENSALKSNHRLVVSDLGDIADTINWIFEILSSTKIDINPSNKRDEKRLELLFKLLLQNFANLRNRYGYNMHGDTEALKQEKENLKNSINKYIPELNEVADYRDLMIVHAQVRTSSMSFSLDLQKPELWIGGGRNLLNTKEQEELNTVYTKYFSEGDENQFHLIKLDQLFYEVINLNQADKKFLDGLMKRSGMYSPTLSKLTILLDNLSEVILKN